MHYYQFNIADYQSHTKHLTPIEDICYRRLLDWQYLHEKPIPNDIKSMCRLLMLREYQADVEQVLNEFFILVEDGWVNNRAFIEIEQFHDKSKKASDAGKASAMKRSLNKKSTNNQINNSNNDQTLNVRSTDVQPTINQEPLTINQEPFKEKIYKKESSVISRPEEVDEQVWNDFLVLRKQKKAPVTQTAINGIKRESIKAGITLSEAIELCCQNGWQGFKAEWLHKQQAPPSSQNKNQKFSAFDYLKGGDGYGNKREQESRIIDIDGEVVSEDEKRAISYRAPI